MKKIFLKLFDIRQGESLRALLMFVYIFLLIASLLIVKPVRSSLFINKFGALQLPYAFLLVAGFAGIFTHFYSKIAKKFRFNILIFYTLVISSSVFFIFWFLLRLNYQANWFYYGFYVWVALFGVISTSQFWLFANYVFNAREAKRLFGFIGAGAISGGIFGGYLTSFLAPILGTANLILFCIFFLVICVLIMSYIWQKNARFNYSEKLRQEKRLRRTVSFDNPIKILFKSRHFAYLAAIVGIGVIAATLVDFQFKTIASEIITDKDRLTAFFGRWFSNLSIASLIVQILLTGRILRVFGVTFSLFLLPVGILVGAFSILINPALWSAILLKVSDGSFKQSINKAGLELLALPLPSLLKNQGKAFIDVFIDSLATGFGGLTLIIFISQLKFSVQNVSYLLLILIVIWFYFIRLIKKEYINSFRVALEKRTIDLQEETINLDDVSVFESLVKMFKSDNERHILYVLQMIEELKNEKFIPYLKKLLDHSSGEIKVNVLKNLIKYDTNLSGDVLELIDDQNFDVKVEAIRYMNRLSDKNGKFLQETLYHSDYKIRSAALLVAAKEYRENENFKDKYSFRKIFEDFLKGCYDKAVDENEKKFMRINFANVIGTAQNIELYAFLQDLLNDQSPDVIQAAIINAGATRDPMFLPILIRHLNTNFVRKNAREALAQFNEDIIDILEEYLINTDVEYRIRIGISKVLSLIGSQKSVNLLLKRLDLSSLMLRTEIIRALNNLRAEFSFLKFDNQIIEKILIKETEKYFKILAILRNKDVLAKPAENDQNEISSYSGTQAYQLLIRALEERLDNNLERIFRLLGLHYPPADMYNAYRGVVSQRANLRANAIEFLDNVLDKRLQRMIIPIIEQSSESLENIAHKYAEIKPESKDEIFQAILEEDDNWLKVCTLYFMAETGYSEPAWLIKKIAADPDQITRETAKYALQRLDISD